jgi:hypothetical protein
MYPRTLVQQLVPQLPQLAPRPTQQSFSDVDSAWDLPAPPAGGQVVEPPPDTTTDLSGSDVDVSVESDPAPTVSLAAAPRPTPSGHSEAEAVQEIQEILAQQAVSSAAAPRPTVEQVAAPVPELAVAAPAPEPPVAASAAEPVFDLSELDGDVSPDNNPALTQSGHTLDARAAIASEPTEPGILNRRLQLRRSIIVAIAAGVGVVALALTVRAFVHRTSASPPSAAPVVSETAAPAVSAAPSPPDVPSAAVAATATAESAAPAPKTLAPSAPAKHRATPRRRPTGPKSGAAKSTR